MHFRTSVAGRLIEDCFLWPRDEQDVLQIKFFATQLLADIFRRKYGALDPREVECKSPSRLIVLSVFACEDAQCRLEQSHCPKEM